MSKNRSEAYRMRRAVAEAAQEHDGAYRDPMAMELIANRYRVPLDKLTKETVDEVRQRKAEVLDAGDYALITKW